jgi:hypothetical protein
MDLLHGLKQVKRLDLLGLPGVDEYLLTASDLEAEKPFFS